MKKEVMISLKGTQNDGEETDKIEFVTEGKFFKKDKLFFITYKESELTGMNGTTTTLKIDDKNGKLTLLRFGTNNSQLIFEKGQRHICCYETGYGALSVGVDSDVLDINVDENGGDIYAKYTIDVDSQAVGKNDFHLTIKERN